MHPNRLRRLARILTAALWLAGACAALAEPAGTGLFNRVIADVGGIPITQREAIIQASLFRGHLVDVSDAEAMKQALEHLCNQIIILDELKNYPDLLLDTLDTQADLARLEKKAGGREALQSLLAALEVGPGEWKELLIRRAALRQFIQLNVKPFVIVTIEDAQRYYDDELVPQLVRESGAAPPVEEVRDQVLQIVTEAKVNQEFRSWLERNRQELKVRVIP